MVSEDDVRELALALPETTEKLSWGAPGFRVNDRLFARLREPGVLVVWVGGLDEKDFLIAADPRKFFTLPHYDGHPSVLARLSALERSELAELLADSWSLRAPKRLRAQLDDEP